jgi:hypothetical protein
VLLVPKDETDTISRLQGIGYLIDEEGTDEDAYTVMKFKGMRVIVKTITLGVLTEYTLDDVYTVDNVKQRLCEETGAPPKTQQLTLKGKPLKDEAGTCLVDCDIKNEDILFMIRTPGLEVEYSHLHDALNNVHVAPYLGKAEGLRSASSSTGLRLPPWECMNLNMEGTSECSNICTPWFTIQLTPIYMPAVPNEKYQSELKVKVLFNFGVDRMTDENHHRGFFVEKAELNLHFPGVKFGLPETSTGNSKIEESHKATQRTYTGGIGVVGFVPRFTAAANTTTTNGTDGKIRP